MILRVAIFLNGFVMAVDTCHFDFYASLRHLFDIINFLPTYFY